MAQDDASQVPGRPPDGGSGGAASQPDGSAAAGRDGVEAGQVDDNGEVRAMASKAELEVEVAELKRMLAEVQASRAAEAADAAADDAEAAAARADAAEARTPPAGMTELEPMLGRLVEDARDMYARQPLLTVAGVFLAGFIFGRAR